MVFVKDVMLKEFPKVNKNETLEHAYRLMRKYDTDRILVVDGDRLVGIMTKWDVMEKLATLRTRQVVPGRLHVSSFMSTDLKTISPTADPRQAAQIMLENNIGGLPVVEDGKAVGLITRWEIASLAKQRIDVRAVDMMAASPVALKPTDTALYARKVFETYNTIFVPVVDEGGRPIGYVTVSEIADALYAFHDIVEEKHRKKRISHLLVEDFMRLRPPYVEPDTPLPKIVEAMIEKKSKGAIVVQSDRIVGIVTLVEILKYYTLYS
ncbi:MAG TPA: CBS domain-containing protein [Pyrodictium sp.]|nr:CBS domain-containing protein [Pyrodictium sp.]